MPLLDLPFPETLHALTLQLHLLRSGRKRLVLLPHGIIPPDATEGLYRSETSRGIFVATDPEEFLNVPYALEHDRIGLLLGYGVSCKPLNPDRAVTLRAGAGAEVLTVVTDEGGEERATRALREMGGETYQITTGHPAAVLLERAQWWLDFFRKLQPRGDQ